MIKVTDKARKRIASIREKQKYGPDHFLRVRIEAGGCSGLTYDLDFDNQSREDDQVFEDNGVKVVTDLKSYLYLHNTTLDFSEGLSGAGFHFINPNASRTCACGESFAL